MSRNVSLVTTSDAGTSPVHTEKDIIAGDRCRTPDQPHIDNLKVGHGQSEACARVSAGELQALFDLIDDLSDIHADMTQMLEHFADLIGVCSACTPRPHAIDALHSLAIANAARASEAFHAFERLAELQHVLLERQLDELLRALGEPEADLHECVSAEYIGKK